MSNFDELIDKFELSLDDEWPDETGCAAENVSIARKALTDAMSAVTSERDILKAKLAEANEENKRLLEAINNIANLGLQKLPVDKRWGTALAFAVEALHRARLAKDES